MAIDNLPAAIQALIQVGILERELEEGLDSVLAYRQTALFEEIPVRVGETLTRTRGGRKAPITTPLAAASNTGLDNGIGGVTTGGQMSSFAIEQYTFSIKQFADAIDLKMMQEQTTIASLFIKHARNNAVQAGQSLERLHRSALFGAYLSGSTRVLASGAPTNTASHVDDVRGFQTVLVNGVVTAVSGAHPLTAVEYGSTGAIRTLTITAVAVDSPTNVSTAPDGVSGVLTYTASPDAAPVAGNAIIANNAPVIFRSFGRLTTTNLGLGDVLTFGLLQDAEAYLRDNAVPSMEDGTYWVILDNTSMRQLFADQQFMVLFAGRDMSEEYRQGQVISLAGLTLVPSTEPYVVLMTNAASQTIRVRRPIVLGAEASIQGNFEGMETFLSQLGLELDSSIVSVDGILHIIREPLSRLQDDVSMAWTWIGDFAIPTDLTATNSIIPTASNALFKRAVVIEHQG